MQTAGAAPLLSSAAMLPLMDAIPLLVVADLDRPQEGALRVSQQALIDTRESMNR